MNNRDEIVLKKVIQYADEIDVDILCETSIDDVPNLKIHCQKITES